MKAPRPYPMMYCRRGGGGGGGWEGDEDGQDGKGGWVMASSYGNWG